MNDLIPLLAFRQEGMGMLHGLIVSENDSLKYTKHDIIPKQN
jgi:hypothetical protein